MSLKYCSQLLAPLLLAVACAGAADFANADEASSVKPQPQPDEFVQMLGSNSYQVRKRAAAELLKLGLQTKAALFAGMKSEDLEIAWQTRRLWSEVRIEASWLKVQTVIGELPESRRLFDNMFLDSPKLWYEFAETPRAPDELFDQQLKHMQELRKENRPINWEGAIANLLYFGVRVKAELPQKQLPRLDDLLDTGYSQQTLADSKPLSRLMDMWTTATTADGKAIDRLLIAMRDRWPQSVDIAREILRDNKASASIKQYALLALAKSNFPEDGELIDGALEDTTPLDILFAKGLLIQSQLRDVALAVEISRNGRNPKEFGFHYLRVNDSTLYSPSSLGFTNATERNAAFEKWSNFNAR
jgi:hypothetical protein